MDGFAPQVLGQLGLVQESPDTLYKAAVERFHDSVMLRHVMRGEPLLGALFVQKFGELGASVFATAVGP
jgi:hypothetical protein